MSALRTVMAQRGMNTGILDQQVTGTPAQKPNIVTPSITPQQALPNAQNVPPVSTATAPAGQAPMPTGSPEAMTIIKALSTRLSNLSKMGV